MEKDIKLKNLKILDAGITIFMVFPLIFMLYGYIVSDGNIIELISKNPKITIGFIGAMVVPFVGIMLKNIKSMIKRKHMEFALISLIILFISQILFFNIVGIALLGILVFKVFKRNSFSFENIKKEIRSEYLNMLFLTGIIVISGGCFILSFRI